MAPRPSGRQGGTTSGFDVLCGELVLPMRRVIWSPPTSSRWQPVLVDPMATLVEHGMLLESARGPLPNVAELVAGEPIHGSWWGHPAGHAIFDAINALAESPDVVRTRLVNGKVTLVHRRVWPALVRVADRFPVARLAAIREEHTASGAHRARAQSFPDWVPSAVAREADKLSVDEAFAALPACLRPTDP